MVEILSNPTISDLYDDVTREFLNNMGDNVKDGIRDILSNVTVVNVDIGDLNALLPPFQQRKPYSAMSGLGNYMMNYGSRLQDGLISDTTSGLMGHEAVHILYTEAIGGLSNFANAYGDQQNSNNDVANYPNGPFETTGYRFGGSRSAYENNPENRSIRHLEQVFMRSENLGWQN